MILVLPIMIDAGEKNFNIFLICSCRILSRYPLHLLILSIVLSIWKSSRHPRTNVSFHAPEGSGAWPSGGSRSSQPIAAARK